MIIYSEKCKVTAVASNKTMDADVLTFRIGEYLSVSMNRSVKLNMTWNGKYFEGRIAGMDFESAGPETIDVPRGPRG